MKLLILLTITLILHNCSNPTNTQQYTNHSITGTWTENNSILTINNDYTYHFWHIYGTQEGTWNLNQDTIIFNFDNKQPKGIFNIKNDTLFLNMIQYIPDYDTFFIYHKYIKE